MDTRAPDTVSGAHLAEPLALGTALLCGTYRSRKVTSDFKRGLAWTVAATINVRGARTKSNGVPHPLVEKAKAEVEQAQLQLDAALRAWDESVSELWKTSLALTQAQKRVTPAHELLRDALDAVDGSQAP